MKKAARDTAENGGVKHLGAKLLIFCCVLVVVLAGVILVLILRDGEKSVPERGKRYEYVYELCGPGIAISDEEGAVIRPEGYPDGIKTGLALQMEKYGDSYEYRTVIDFSSFPEMYDGETAGSKDNAGYLYERYLSDREELAEKFNIGTIDLEKYESRLALLTEDYRESLSEAKSKKDDWLYGKKVRIMISYGVTGISDGYYLVTLTAGEIAELAEEGYILRGVGLGERSVMAGKPENIAPFLAWRMDNASGDVSACVSLKVSDGAADISPETARESLSALFSAAGVSKELAGVTVNFRFDGGEIYTTADFAGEFSVSELREIARNEAVYLSADEKGADPADRAAFYYSVYGDGFYETAREIKK